MPDPAASGGKTPREERKPMEDKEIRQGIVELRDEAFRLAEELAREPSAMEAATSMQSVAYLLGEVERLTTSDRLTPA
jgi:hypothetical protein